MIELYKLYDIYHDLNKMSQKLPEDWKVHFNADLRAISQDLIFIKKAILTNDIKIFQAVCNRYATKYNYESGFFFKKNYDLDEGWTAFLDAYRAGKVKSLQEWVKKKRRTKVKAVRNIPLFINANIGPIDSYCDSDINESYWKELLKGEDDDAVKDFIAYIKEIKC